jgi:lactoylglutathione lyase
VVEESDGDLMGDSVNIAARLEGIADPGGICLSEDAYRQVRDRLKEGFAGRSCKRKEKTLGAEVLRTMQHGKPRIDLKIGGANIFIAPVAPGDRVNAAPTTPYRGLDHFGLAVTGIDAIAADLKAKGVEFTREPTTIRPGVRVCFIRGPEGVSIELLDRDVN